VSAKIIDRVVNPVVMATVATKGSLQFNTRQIKTDKAGAGRDFNAQRFVFGCAFLRLAVMGPPRGSLGALSCFPSSRLTASLLPLSLGLFPGWAL